MAAPTPTLPDLRELEAALVGNRPVDEILDLADDTIEWAAAADDVAALERLASMLERAAAAGRPGARGLSLAAARARAVPVQVPPAEPSGVRAPAVTTAPEIAPPPEAVPAVRFAGWWQRALAHLVDWFALLLALGFLPFDSAGGYLAAFVAFPLAYFAGMHAYVRGQTIGKALFGIAVRRDEDGAAAIDLATAIWRAIAQCVLWLTVIGGIVDALAPLGDGRRRALHDRLAGTVVVRVR